MQAGYDVTLATGVEVECTVRSKEGVEYMALAAHQERERHLEFALFPWFFARRAKACSTCAPKVGGPTEYATGIRPPPFSNNGKHMSSVRRSGAGQGRAQDSQALFC